MSQINLKQLLAGDGQQEYIDKLNFNFGQISQFGGGPPGLIGLDGSIGQPGGRGPIGLTGLTGLRGTLWSVVDTDPSMLPIPNTLPNDLAFNRSTGHLFAYDGTKWSDEGKLIEDGTFTERNGSVYYNLPLHENIIKSLVLSPVDYKTLNIDPLSQTFRPVVKLLSNNLSNAFLTLGYINSLGLETPQTKQIGFYLDEMGTGTSAYYDFIISNSAGNNTFEAGPNHFKIGKDNTYRFSTSGAFDRLLIDLSDINERYLLFGGDLTGTTKLHIGSSKSTTFMMLNDIGNVGINTSLPEAKFHVNADDIDFIQGSSKVANVVSARVGGGNNSKLQYEFTRFAEGLDNFESDSVASTLVRVDGNYRSGYMTFVGGQTNLYPKISFGFGATDTVIVDLTSVTVIGDLTSNHSLTVGSRIGVIGIESFTVGGTTTATKQGSVAIGDSASSTHKNAVVIGSNGTSLAEDAVFVYKSFSVKNGLGTVAATKPYFASVNPSTLCLTGLNSTVMSSIQHDGSTDGLEIVTFGSPDPLNSSGTSFAVTKANLDGTKPVNLFSVKNNGVTIGNAFVIPTDPTNSYGTADVATYDLSVSLILQNGVVFNPSTISEDMVIGASEYSFGVSSAPRQNLITKRGNIIIQGGKISSFSGLNVTGGDVVIVGGDFQGGTDSKPGNVVIGFYKNAKRGSLLIGKSDSAGTDNLQVKGTSYFEQESAATAGNLILAAVGLNKVKLTKSTAVSGYVNSVLDVSRSTIDSTYTVAGKLGYIRNGDTYSSFPGEDLHQTFEYGVYGDVSKLAINTAAYAAYFNDDRAAPNLPAVYINKKGLALETTGYIYSHDAIYASEFVPGVNWFNIPFSFLSVIAKSGSTTVSGAPGTATEAVLVSDPFEMANLAGQDTTASIKAYRYGQLVHIAFHFTISLRGPLGTLPDSYILKGLPILFRASTTGMAYAYANSIPDANGRVNIMEGFIPVITRTTELSGGIQFLLPKGNNANSDWSNTLTLKLSGTIICNASLEDFTPPAANFSSGSNSGSSSTGSIGM